MEQAGTSTSIANLAGRRGPARRDAVRSTKQRLQSYWRPAAWPIRGEVLLWALALALLAGLTWHTWRVVERWQPVGEPLLAVGRFGPDLAGWQVRAEGGEVRVEDGALVVEAVERSAFVAVDRIVPLAAGVLVLRLEATVETREVVRGPRPWHLATLVLVGRLPGGQRDQSVPHRLVGSTGTISPTSYARTFHLRQTAQDAYLSIRMQQSLGTMLVSGLRLQPVQERAGFQNRAFLTLVGWGLFLMATAARFVQTARHRGPAGAMLVILGFGLLYNLFPDTMASPLIVALQDEFGAAASHADPVKRMLHFAGFVGVAFLLKLARPRDPVLLHLVVLVLLAVGSELLQIVRGDLTLDDGVDAAVNLVGAALGFGLGLWARRREQRLRQEARERTRRLFPRRTAEF
ncbi:MAG TPA: hypothetical protein VFG43_12115 [Geminicoccaceae bacterium]|nr:hypothetical protein [Geminicoccaceae bacterium]